jgi:GntR family transcriptional regulator/MocR family aminotransferase
LAAGCHALLRLPDGTSERAVVATAATMGVRVNGLGSYRFGGAGRAEPDPRPPALVLGFGNVSERQISRGIRVLAEAVAHETGSMQVAVGQAGKADGGQDHGGHKGW